MLDPKLRNVMLVDELQLGERLNESLTAGDRADFALLLSMLSQHVDDAPQFADGIRDQEKVDDLRVVFGLPQKTAFYAEESDFVRAVSLSERLSDEGMSEVHLCECIKSEPITELKRTLSPEVFSSLCPLTQEKFLMQIEGQKLTHEKIHERGDGFGILDEIAKSHGAFKEEVAPSFEAQA